MNEAHDDVRPQGPQVGAEPTGVTASLPGCEERGTTTEVSRTAAGIPGSAFRRHPVRWTVAAGGLALVLALGGYGVTQAATSSTSSTSSSTGTDTAAVGTSTGGPPGMSGSGASKASSSSAPAGTSRAGGTQGALPGGLGTATKAGQGGRVTAISGDTITLTTLAGKTITVTVTSSTVVKEGTTTSALGALKDGDLVVVTGSTSLDGTVTATTVTFGMAPVGAPGKNTPSGA